MLFSSLFLIESEHMETDLLLQLVESFLDKSASYDASKTIDFNNPFTASESLEFSGNAIFHDEVDMAGHTLRIYGNVRCKGSIQNASLLVYGSVIIDGACKNCNVFSHNSIQVHHSSESNFWSYGDIGIEVESVNSSYSAAGSIDGKTAAIRGGRLASNGNIILDSVSSLGEYGRASLIIGDRKIIFAKVSAIDANIKRLESDLVEVTDCVNIFARKIVEKRLIGVHIPEFERMKKQKIDLEKELAQQKELREQFLQMHTSMNKKSTGNIVIRSRAGSDIFIEIEGSRLETQQAAQSVLFYTDGKEILMDTYYPELSQHEVLS
jgi:uncharacterized protein (DUF342 family)